MAHHQRKRHIIAFAAVTALCLLGDSMLYIVLPLYYADMGLSSLWEVGVLLSANRLVRLPLNPCVGWLYSRISERAGILLAIALAAGTTFSYGFLSGFWFWLLARCIWGVAWTLLRLGSLFCILRMAGPENRGQYTGLYNGLYRLGSLVGMLLGGLLADVAGVRWIAVLFGVATALSCVPALLFIPHGQPAARLEKSGLASSLGLAFENAGVFWIVAGGGIVACVLQGVLASTLSRLIDAHAPGGVELWGAFWGAATLAGLFQALRWGWEPWLAPWVGRFTDTRCPRPRMLAYALGCGALLLGALALPLTLPVWFCALLGMQLAATVLTTVTDATASDAAAERGGRALLMTYALVMDVGAALGPLMAYALDALLGIDAVYACSALLFALLGARWSLRM